MDDDIVERLRDVGCDREPFTPDHANCICRLAHKAADEIERMRDALKLIGLRNHPTTFREDTDWYEVADCMVGIARRGLGETVNELTAPQESGSRRRSL
jgi:hypothetical protein